MFKLRDVRKTTGLLNPTHIPLLIGHKLLWQNLKILWCLINQEEFPGEEAGWCIGCNCVLRDQAACTGSLTTPLLASELL